MRRSVSSVVEHPGAPRAVIVRVVGADRHAVGPVEHVVPCDLELVERLLRLRLHARRLGWTLVLDDVDDELVDLLDLVGVTSLLTETTQADHDGGSLPAPCGCSGGGVRALVQRVGEASVNDGPVTVLVER